jgi:radical SAM protein with 4Fe4S-binding SPASM domain
MLGTIKTFIRFHATSNRFLATAIGLAFGIWGLIQAKRGSRDHLGSTISLTTKSTFILGRPMNVTLEQINVCNLECPVCETGAGILGRSPGHMSTAKFRRIVDEISPHTNTLMFYFMGEPFLNKYSYEMIRYAKTSGIPFVETCTNGDFVDPVRLVSSGLDKVSFQIGGLTQETHEIYRKNGNLERVLSNLRDTIYQKRIQRSRLQIDVGFIVMKHNEHQVDRFRRTMLELGVDRALIVDPCVRTISQGNQFLPNNKDYWLYDQTAYERGILKPKVVPKNSCPWIYYSVAIHVNGDVVPCCRDPKGEEVMGNIFRERLVDIWNSPQYRNFRHRIMHNQSSVGICKLCSSYPVSRIH